MTWAILVLACLQEGDPEAVRRQLHDILDRREFHQKMPSDFWARLRERLRLRSEPEEEPAFERSEGRCPISTEGSGSGGGLMNILYIVGIAILAAFLIAIGYHAWTRRRIQPAAKTAVPAVSVYSSDLPDPLAMRSEEWALEADRLYQQGRIAEAIRALYLAALSHAHLRRWIDYHPSRTNWEHVRTFAGPRPLQPTLGSLTSLFERKWYGRKPAEDSEYRSGRDLAASLLRAGEAS